MTGKTIKGSSVFVYFSRWSSVVAVIRTKNNVVSVYFALNVYADSDKYSFNLLGGTCNTVVPFTPKIHSLFLFPT